MGPIRDSGKVHIPTLKVAGADSSVQDVSSNEEKGEVLHHMFFPDKPTGSYTPHDPEYPDQVDYNFQPLIAQLRCCIVRLSPHKAPGQDGIPNIVLKESMDLIAEYLLCIYQATFMLNMYSNAWHEWDTIVLQKPSKPGYNVLKAYRPIVLMNTMGKVLSVICGRGCRLHV